jgi:hypothetical protein
MEWQPEAEFETRIAGPNLNLKTKFYKKILIQRKANEAIP